jgi:hypothetical protein
MFPHALTKVRHVRFGSKAENLQLSNCCPLYPLKADVAQRGQHVRFVPTTEVALLIRSPHGAGEQRWGQGNAKVPCRLQVDDESMTSAPRNGKLRKVFGIGTVDPRRACRRARLVKCELAHSGLRFSVAQSESAEGSSYDAANTPVAHDRHADNPRVASDYGVRGLDRPLAAAGAYGARGVGSPKISVRKKIKSRTGAYGEDRT